MSRRTITYALTLGERVMHEWHVKNSRKREKFKSFQFPVVLFIGLSRRETMPKSNENPTNWLLVNLSVKVLQLLT